MLPEIEEGDFENLDLPAAREREIQESRGAAEQAQEEIPTRLTQTAPATYGRVE